MMSYIVDQYSSATVQVYACHAESEVQSQGIF